MQDEGEDREAILSRRQFLIAGALSGIATATSACAAPRACLAALPGAVSTAPLPEPLLSFSRAPGRNNTPHDRVRDDIRRVLQDDSVYATWRASSVRWQVRLSLHGTIQVYYGNKRVTIFENTVDMPTLTAIVELADRAWREVRPFGFARAPDPDVVLAMRDEDDIFVGHPVSGSAAEALLVRLRAEAERARLSSSPHAP